MTTFSPAPAPFIYRYLRPSWTDSNRRESLVNPLRIAGVAEVAASRLLRSGAAKTRISGEGAKRIRKMADDVAHDLKSLTADIVTAYVSNNKVSGEDLSKLIEETYQALSSAGAPAPAEPEAPRPDKAAVKKSIHPDHLTSFLDGRRYKSLKRHLNTQGITPDEYRTRFGLPKDYPMVAPGYSAQRSALAKTLGLGRKAAAPEPTPAAKPDPTPAKPTKAVRGRRSKAIKPEDETFT
jgi:predicted transcriptional regulator